MQYQDEREKLLDERESLLTLCVHHDGQFWWTLTGVTVKPGDCASEFSPGWQSFGSRDEACKAALAAGLALRLAPPE